MCDQPRDHDIPGAYTNHIAAFGLFEGARLVHQSLNGNVIGEDGGQCNPDSAIFCAKTGVADMSHGAPHSQLNTATDNAI